MPKGSRGFDPQRLNDVQRPRPIVPSIVDPTPQQAYGFTEVKIIGIGGGGCNAVNRMVEVGIHGVEFITINTDNQDLSQSLASKRIAIGGRATRGLGAGGNPDVGQRAAEVSRDAIEAAIEGADMVFITAGLGGGTGTGAAPVVAEIARRHRALTVAVVTLPFSFEGARRRQVAEAGLAELRQHVDALIAIPNDRLLKLADRSTSVVEAFRLCDDILRQGVQGMAELVTITGLINVDFADVKAVMAGAGTALIGIGEAAGEGRALHAMKAAMNSPLLDTSIEGARNVLLNITGGPDMTLQEVNEAASFIGNLVDKEANIILGAVVHPRPQPTIRITLIATGIPGASSKDQRPAPPFKARTYGASEPPAPPRQSDLDLPPFLRRRT